MLVHCIEWHFFREEVRGQSTDYWRPSLSPMSTKRLSARKQHARPIYVSVHRTCVVRFGVKARFEGWHGNVNAFFPEAFLFRVHPPTLRQATRPRRQATDVQQRCLACFVFSGLLRLQTCVQTDLARSSSEKTKTFRAWLGFSLYRNSRNLCAVLPGWDSSFHVWHAQTRKETRLVRKQAW